ncbi:MAG TPA: alpha/beta fold hydrolase [Candidatus Binataceae bacterium]|nr:alpha/beta fold hydrolase [Candidatus Binataceae bacterium]
MDWNETSAELARAWAEQPVIIPGKHGNLFGIFTPPDPDVPPARLCAILLGRNRWWGDRLSVKSARWLAARGFACLRFDYHGYGESEGQADVIEPDSPYPEDALAAIRYMREELGQQRFVLSGFCFDGRTALSAVEQEGASIEGVVAIAAPPGEKLTHFSMFKLRHFLRAPFSLQRRALGPALRRRLYPLFPHFISHPEKARRGSTAVSSLVPVSDRFKREIAAVLRARVRCLFLYGSEDAEYYNFKLAERSLLANLDPRQKSLITVTVWAGRVHVADEADRQRQVSERALAWIDGLRCEALQPVEATSFLGRHSTTNGFSATSLVHPASGIPLAKS